VGIIVEEVDRLDRVVRSVLDYGRPAQGNPGSVDVNAAVRRTLQVLASSREQAVRFDLEFEAELPTVRADEEQLRQVVMNLVRNAEEAQGGMGSVTVATRLRPGRSGPGSVEIAVRDQGPGIPREVIEQLFVPFFTTKARGTGLGLAISQRLVQAMGGSIEVTSPAPGRTGVEGAGPGAQFTILLPGQEPGGARPSLRPDRTEATASTGSAGSGAGVGAGVLAVPVLPAPRP
jgi:signal transduction histidine kinase